MTGSEHLDRLVRSAFGGMPLSTFGPSDSHAVDDFVPNWVNFQLSWALDSFHAGDHGFVMDKARILFPLLFPDPNEGLLGVGNANLGLAMSRSGTIDEESMPTVDQVGLPLLEHRPDGWQKTVQDPEALLGLEAVRGAIDQATELVPLDEDPDGLTYFAYLEDVRHGQQELVEMCAANDGVVPGVPRFYFSCTWIDLRRSLIAFLPDDRFVVCWAADPALLTDVAARYPFVEVAAEHLGIPTSPWSTNR